MADLGERVQEAVEAQSHAVNQAFNYMNSMALKCAIELGIADVIHQYQQRQQQQQQQQHMPLSQLAMALSIQPPKVECLRRLMRLLVHSGLFSQHHHNDDNQEEERYSLTSASRYLLKDEPLSGRSLLLFHLNPTLTAPWHFLSAWFRNDDPTPFHTAHGKPYWEYAVEQPDFGNLFNDAMAADSRIIATLLITTYREVFQSLSSLVDVGAGTGTVIKAIAQAFPHLSCTAFDQPHVVADIHSTNGDIENLEVVGGDMFDAIPAANAVILKWVLHNWSDEECVKILKKCKEAIPSKEKGGKLIIIDMVVEDNNNKRGRDAEAVETQLLWDMRMMTVLTGKQRTEKEWEKVFVTAGFTSYNISAELDFRSLIQVYP